jgi:hypothetical protein
MGFSDTAPLGGTALAFIALPHPNPFLFSLAGLFVVSLVSNATPFFGASYSLIAITELIAFGFSIDAFILVVIITAAGAALGKLIIYGTAKGLQRTLSKNRNVQLLGEWLQDRRFLVAVFITAVVPLLPLDDYIYIGAGASKGRLLPMFSVTIAAKLVKSAAEIGLGFFGMIRVVDAMTHLFGLNRLEFSVLLTIFFIALGIFIFEYDWESLLHRGARQPTPPSGPSPQV